MEISSDKKEDEGQKNCIEMGPPYEALFLVLAYLPVFELLCMSEVCKSLRDAVNNEILPWLQHITVEKPLNSRLSDEFLVKITSKASRGGRLKTLALINCVKITDYGLHQVIESNPLITKLYVPGCTSLSPDGVVRAVKTLTKHNHDLTSLKINGIYGIKKHHLETLRSTLGPNQAQQKRETQTTNSKFYHEYKNFTAFEREEPVRQIDLDTCAKCDQARMVFDCPRENCECRGCYHCVPRCIECGKCVEFEEEEEPEDAACEDTLCSDCWFRLPKCSFCNRPYCNQHADQQCNLRGSSGFICFRCHVKFLTSPCD